MVLMTIKSTSVLSVVRDGRIAASKKRYPITQSRELSAGEHAKDL